MDSAFWDRVQSLFADLSALPPAERRSRLEASADLTPELRSEVASLLDAHTQAEAQPRTTPVALGAGDLVGPFQLTSLIGEGGMGRVYLAVRVSGGFAQRVAVKLIDSHDAASVRRFSAERQILAELSHPHVVSLIDGGFTSTGQPYLVMEYVEGVPVTEYCQHARPSLSARLRLLARVASAVQYAHERGVIHRDLKPANIVVTRDGSPKVLDFGIATAFGEASWMSTRTTAGQPTALTMAYASPEQVRGRPATPASDVYALGVIAHEILTGARPYDLDDLPFDEVIGRVSSGRHPAPSAAPRSPGLPYDPATLPGRIDAAVRQAMAVSTDDRFATAGDFQRELEASAAAVDAADLTGLAAHSRQRPSGLTRAGWAAALVVAAGIGVYAVWPGDGPGTPVDPVAVEPAAEPAVSSISNHAQPALAAASDGRPPRPSVPPAPGTATPAERRGGAGPAGMSPLATPPLVPDGSQADAGRSMQRAAQLRDRAMAALEAGRAVEASNLITEVIVLRREQVTANPGDSLTHARLAWSLTFLARARLAANQLTEAEAAAVEGASIAERLAPQGVAYRLDLAGSLHVLASVIRASGRPDAACATFTRTKQVLDAISTGQLAADRAERATSLATSTRDALGLCRAPGPPAGG